MLRRIKNLLTKSNGSTFDAAQFPPVCADQSFYAIGDIHGRADLLKDMLQLIEVDDKDPPGHITQLVFMGDYVDRGEQSAQVLQCLFDLEQSMPTAITCLLGNHEKMLLGFLDNPEINGSRWLKYGGLQTLASFQIGDISENMGVARLVKARDALRLALPKELENWLRHLPYSWKSGNVICAHAGMNPDIDPQSQSEAACIWGTRRFLQTPRPDGNWVIYGHYAGEKPNISAGRISIDTGAYYSGRLTAAVIEAGVGKVRFLTT